MRPDLGHDGGAKGHVGDEMAVHDVDMEPIRAPFHRHGTFCTELCKVGAEDGGRDDRWWRHGEGVGRARSQEEWTLEKEERRNEMNWSERIEINSLTDNQQSII